jgi:hypothetical protein
LKISFESDFLTGISKKAPSEQIPNKEKYHEQHDILGDRLRPMQNSQKVYG